MILLALPSEEKNPNDWKDFRFALTQHNLRIVKTLEETSDFVKIQINTASQEQEEIIIELVELCFRKYYQV